MIKDNYVDIHSHVLYGVDDGARTMDESLKMIEMAHHEGIRTMILTPHYGIENGYAPDARLIRDNFQALEARARVTCPDMRLHLGAELYCAPGKVLERVAGGEALKMAGSKYLLLEFLEWGDHHESAEHICQSMIDIAGTDWLPILAHAQRYKAFAGKEQLYHKMVAAGVYFQINAYDLYDRPDDWTRDNARWLVANKLAHFMGTDAHRADRRQPVMRSGVKYLYDHCPGDYVDALVHGNAHRLLAGERVALSL